jgi:tetratricopeptide (TPR) repeat protein
MRSTRFRERDRAAYEAYRQGRSLQLQGDPRSVEFFQKSVELDPRDADAYAALASAYVSMARAGGEPEKLFPQAVAAAGKALDIDSTSPEAHNALANARFWFDWNWREAERHFTLALGARPSYAAAHHDYAWFLIAMGRTEQGLAALRRAIELDPFSVRIHMDAGWLLLGAHFEESIREAKRALDLSPGLEEAHLCIERAQLFLGRNAPAAEGGADPYWLALHYALSGDKLRAMRELHHAYEGHSIMMPLVRVEPAFSALRGDEKFEALVARVGIP